VIVRGFGVSALAHKTAAAAGAVKATTAGGRKAVAKKTTKPKRAAAGLAASKAKPKKPAAKKKPAVKKSAAKPKRAAVKKAKAVPKKELRETIVTLPKAAPNAYSLYVRDAWKAGKDALPPGTRPEAAFAAISRSSASAWRALGDAAKQQYRAQHDAAKQQHEQAVRAWWAGADRTQVNLENQRRRRHNRRAAQGVIKGARLALLKDPLAPKRPAGAYLLFMKENMAGTSGGVAENAKAHSAQWRAMSDAAKAPYVAAAQAEAGAYKVAAEKYAKQHSN
ncbi:hypothetical protein GGF38_003375, partial [Coemansia sp. RSA 25]